MFTIVVELLSSLVAHVVRWAFAACCGRAPGVLSAPPSPTSNGHHSFNIPSLHRASVCSWWRGGQRQRSAPRMSASRLAPQRGAVVGVYLEPPRIVSTVREVELRPPQARFPVFQPARLRARPVRLRCWPIFEAATQPHQSRRRFRPAPTLSNPPPP